MESQKTKILLQKYWEGQTTVEEESALSEQFGGEVPEDEQKYSVIFDYKDHLQNEAHEDFDLSFLVKEGHTKRRSFQGTDSGNWKKWSMGIAASIVMAVCSVTYQWPQTQTLQAKSIEMERAYTETLATLQLVANKLNKGTASIQEISVFDKTTKHIIHEN